jgi:hypothetical protein
MTPLIDAEPAVSMLGTLVRAYWKLVVLLLACIATVAMVNWWYSPLRQIEAVGEAAGQSGRFPWSQADRELWAAFDAGSGEFGATSYCLRSDCYVRLSRSYFRFNHTAPTKPVFQAYVAVDLTVTPVPSRIHTFWPTEFRWKDAKWKWSVETEVAGEQRRRHFGNWDELSRVPMVGDKDVVRPVLDGMASALERALQSGGTDSD